MHSLLTITLPTSIWISKSIVGITTKFSVKLSSRPYFWVEEEVENFSLSEKHTF
ncbi:hypothetical protein LEP1GSC020_3403 [Leptospira interrogans serovar Grippotyphosa str. 2006006986]|nr:hypothetical protein LEP1GSC009_0716 [Leptospira interrogans serovar Grippotyphosa str. Andaman]EKP83590.1 hypothetical protein LEP1GSC020_3403 [Leptospira interrogans serovar Grippotyphosa str. 2006006986]